MNPFQKQYQTFIASVCTQFECKDAIAPLQEGFSALCEAIEGESAWNDVERIHVFHEADPSLDLDINLNSLWKVRQKNSVTKDDVVRTFIEDAVDLNKWMTSSKDGRAVITSATIKFKDDPEEIRVDIPAAPVCKATFSEPSIADDHTAEEAAECHLRKAGYVTRCSLKDVGPEGGTFEVICLTREPLEALDKELANNGYGIIGHITEDSELPYFILPVSVPREATGRGKEDFMRILGKYIAPEEPGGAELVGYSDGIPVYKATEETKKMLGESSDEDYDGRDSFTRCRNCGAEVYDDDLDNQGYCPDCHDVCYTDTRTPTKWDRM